MTVWTQLQQLGQTAADAVPDTAPPDDLLARLLDDASDPGLRGRAAVPVRGAISGARPGLTVALIATMFAIAAAAVWTGWHLGSRWRAEE